MKNEDSNVTRRKLLGWLGVLSVFAFMGGIFKRPVAKKPKTIKMLAQDGTLVEVDASLIASANRKVTNKELQNWVNRK